MNPPPWIEEAAALVVLVITNLGEAVAVLLDSLKKSAILHKLTMLETRGEEISMKM